MLAGDPPLPGEKLWGGDKKWKKVGVGGFQWSITAARERLEEDSKIFTHLLGWRRRRSSQRRLQRKAHKHGMRLAVNAHLMKQLRTSAFFVCFNENRSSRNQPPRSAGGRPLTSVVLFDNRGAFLKSCTSENNKNKREEQETHAKLITDCCPCKRVRPPPPPPSPTYPPPPSPRYICSHTTSLSFPNKRCSKTNHAVKIAVLPRQRHDVNKLLWRDRRTSGNQSTFGVRCVYCNPGLASRSLSALVVLPGFDTCARLQRAGSLGGSHAPSASLANVDWWLL